jgi:hypothetical protein
MPMDEDWHEYSEDVLVDTCIKPEHLAAGHDCATPSTFTLHNAVTGLLRELETVELLARNHYRASAPSTPVKYRSIWLSVREARQKMGTAETLLAQLWKEQDKEK